ncbi:MAG: UDP-4-amino-4,6-dideoxy-N-acetyl-beta-L-altrosamine transaminase [Alphaproteobacteria bacterium]
MTDERRSFLPYGRQYVDEDDIARVVAVLRGEWLTTGPTVAAYEAALAARVSAQHAVSCSSGTAGLHLAALALGLGPGDAVIVPAQTFVATANGAAYTGADVILADVDPDTGLLRPAGIETALARADGRRVRAVFPVHLNGQCADMPAIAALARRHGLAVVEDACHALGGEVAGSPVGACAHSDMAVFSTHPVKTVTTGEGGAVTTGDAELARRLRLFRGHGIEREPDRFADAAAAMDPHGNVNPWYYEMQQLGYNYRATDIHCALGLGQLAKLDRFVAERAALADRYAARLARLAPLVRPLPRAGGCRPAWHLAVALVDFAAAGTDRGTVMRRLRAVGVGSQVHYIPVHCQPYWRARCGVTSLPGAEAYYRRALSLPLFVGMTAGDVDRVVDALADALAPGDA